MAAVSMRYRGFVQRDLDIWDKIGTRMFAVAVLEATSVTIVVPRAMMKLTHSGGRL